MKQNTTAPDVLRSKGAAERAPMETTILTNEEKATQDAKLKPEREAKFADYTVSTQLCYRLRVMSLLLPK